ncbi:neuroblastoma breakpoint family member 4-like [Lemur catta]|uniref:neuroblastoma breakpoint family member 4-like n=1 Tax=Lemur catta TaxID=9447 RepID=UPI001E26731D|nr:neuroblastoma breakpoint family member 4-like [Lemur catta]
MLGAFYKMDQYVVPPYFVNVCRRDGHSSLRVSEVTRVICLQAQMGPACVTVGMALFNVWTFLNLFAENYEEEEDEEDLESLASSGPSELQEDAGTAGLSQALTEQGFPPGGADLSDCREPIRSATSLSAEPEAESVLDGAAPTQEACPQGPWSGDLSPCVSQVQAANTQLQPSALVTDCLQLQLDQQWGRGCGFATWSLPCDPWILAASADSGHQWLLLPVLGFPGAQPRLPALAQTVSPLLAGPSALKPRKSERKLLFSKWRVTCSFSGLQLRVQSRCNLRLVSMVKLIIDFARPARSLECACQDSRVFLHSHPWEPVAP